MINMLGLAKRVRARILQASTSEVYGDPLVHPQTEEYWGNVNPIGLRSCYDEGKRIAETLMMDYHRQNHVDTRIAQNLQYLRTKDAGERRSRSFKLCCAGFAGRVFDAVWSRRSNAILLLCR